MFTLKIDVTALLAIAVLSAAGCSKSGSQGPPSATQPGGSSSGGSGSRAAAGDTVAVHYALTRTTGEKIESSRGGKPLEFVVSAPGIIPGFSKAVLGMAVGEKKTVTLPPEDAYGKHDPQKVIRIAKAQLGPTADKIQAGDKLMLRTPQGPAPVKVVAVAGDIVTLDANPELVDQTLVFDIEMVSIKKP